MRWIAAVVACVGLLGCSSGEQGDEKEPARWVAVDSSFALSWNPLENGVRVYRVELRARDRVRGINGVVSPMPVLVGDSLLTGIQIQGRSAARFIFRVHARSGRRSFLPVPSDVWPLFHDVAISPDGRHVAYVGGDLGFSAIVREVESGRLVVRGPALPGCGCTTDRSHARWVDADSFEVAVHGLGDAPGWQLVAGRASARRFRADTLASEPDWP
ncbi:MAG TPA: hypothetical protein VNP72_07145 [Longimicrobium sp.]|nr:hypothetical protein [Longimicrobium sp.]